MLHHERLRPPSRDYPADEWNVIEKSFRPDFLAQVETMLALGNGYIGMRGCPEEGGPNVENGTFINGFYETWPIVYGEEAFGFAKTGQTICNVTDSKIIKLFVDDEPFWLPNAHLLAYDRRLNMRAGTLDRTVTWETPSGKQVSITSRRLVSFVNRHVIAISYCVTLVDAQAFVVISSEMTTHKPSGRGDRDDPRLARAFSGQVLHPQTNYAKDQRIVLCHTTERSRYMLACATDHSLESSCSHSHKVACTPDFGQVAYAVDAKPGCPIQLTKYMVYHTSHTASAEELCGRAEWTMDRVVTQGFQRLLASQEQYMDDFWRRSDVRIKDITEQRVQRSTVEIQQAIRFNLFHILQASARAEGAGVPAKGFTGQAYEGHYFWDTEIYVLPFLIYTSPWIARNLLAFRYKMLPQARARARELGHRGAMYPWRTISGEEASAYYAAGTAQYHINADIMYALRKYVQATGDEEFLRKYGAEMLVETARMWLDLGFYSDAKGGRFCINGVTGPDEYNAVVNNNAYTNLMARENLRYAAEVVESLRTAEAGMYDALAQKTALDPSEVNAWIQAAGSMYVPSDETLNVILQDDNFLDREPWDFRNTPRDRYPLLLFYHPLNIYRTQVIKQADVILAMFLLGDTFSSEVKKRNFDFYDPLTTGDSSLSSCVEAIIAAQVGDMDKAFRYGMAALLMDLADVGGNVKDGCHIASMGGTWMMLTYGFGGMRDDDGTLSFWPRRAPEENAILRFPITYRGRLLCVEIGLDKVEYTLREGERLVIRHEKQEVELTREHPVAVRPVSRR
ncbi:glycosyl hydrolase family 65 protein [Bradyrhizobium sp. Leo170]|uniref:glycoside hydrolase family 65 protein n=1 Tax=Bradyrhizobium sp. Leo170 TaxID=1571199 RepID=UPI00102E9355|nr:glycosyl hydrolase family 65 protein [Bradyrhizobium sp. Leo170]TAI65724.1 family 65 glycosyl hydrolase [Bradyrhizobium sp. Leo170]